MLLTGVNASLADGTGNTGWESIVTNVLDNNIPGGDTEPSSGPQLYLKADGTVSTSSDDALFSIKLWGNFIYYSGYIGFKEDNSFDYNYLKISSLRSGYYIKKIVLYDSNMSEDKEDDNNPVITASNGTWSIGYYSGGQSTSPSSTTTAGSSTGATHIVATCSTSTDNNYVTIKADDHTRFHYIYIEYNTKQLNSIDTSTPFQYTCAFSTTAHQVDWTGSAITPVSNVKSISSYLNRNLIKDTHYTVTGTTSATAPGKYSTTITAKTGEGALGEGALADGNISFNWWIIKPITHSDITVEVDPVVFNGTVYDLAAVKSKVKVYDMIGGTKTQLTEGTHYTLSLISGHSQFLNAKTYVDELVITGVADNGYTGERKTSFTISQRDISEVALTTAKAYASGWSVDQDGLKTWIQADAQGNIKYGTYKLIENTDYTIDIAPATYHDAKVYTGAITLTAIDNGNFTGTDTWDFEISNGTNIAENYTVVYVNNIYTGQNLPPTKANTKVYKGGTLLTADTDYTWAMAGGAADYKDAKTYANAVIIKGKNEYFGTIYANYEILPYNIADTKVIVTAADMTWTGGVLTKNQSTIAHIVQDGYTIRFTVGSTPVDLTPTTDFNITSVPEVIQNEGEYSLVFEGVGNFTGTKSTKFDVKKDLSDNTTNGIMIYDIPTQIMLYNGGASSLDEATYSLKKLNIEIRDANSHALLYEGDDYTLEYYYEDGETGNISSTSFVLSEANPITHSSSTLNEKKFFVKIKGVAPKYTGEIDKPFYTVAEYQKMLDNTSDIDPCRIIWYHIDTNNPGYPDNSIKGKVSVGAPVGSAITNNANNKTKKLTIPGETAKIVGDLSNNPIKFEVAGIEPNAFEGSTELRWIDATALPETFTPNSLNRTVSNTTFYGVPKQALVYLNGNTITGENYVYKKNGTEYVCDVFKIYDDVNGNQQGFTETGYKWAYENLYPFTANTIENTRQLKAGQHYTVCLPYRLPIPSTLKAYTLDASSTTLVGFKEVILEVSPFTPYVVIASGTGNLLSISTGGQVPATTYTEAQATELNAVAKGNYQLVGTMRYMDGTAAQSKYIMQADKTWKQIPATNGYTGACILPMRAYINATASPARLSATFTNADGSTTAIRDLQLDNDGDDTFDLQGRKVNGQSAAKGVYIKNGKKLYK